MQKNTCSRKQQTDVGFARESTVANEAKPIIYRKCIQNPIRYNSCEQKNPLSFFLFFANHARLLIIQKDGG